MLEAGTAWARHFVRAAFAHSSAYRSITLAISHPQALTGQLQALAVGLIQLLAAPQRVQADAVDELFVENRGPAGPLPGFFVTREQVAHFQADGRHNILSRTAGPAVNQHTAVRQLTDRQAGVFVIVRRAAGFPLIRGGLLYLVQPPQHFLQASRCRRREGAVFLQHGYFLFVGAGASALITTGLRRLSSSFMPSLVL